MRLPLQNGQRVAFGSLAGGARREHSELDRRDLVAGRLHRSRRPRRAARFDARATDVHMVFEGASGTVPDALAIAARGMPDRLAVKSAREDSNPRPDG